VEPSTFFVRKINYGCFRHWVEAAVLWILLMGKRDHGGGLGWFRDGMGRGRRMMGGVYGLLFSKGLIKV